MGHKTVTAVTAISKIQKRAFARSSALVVIYGEELGRKFDLEEGKTIIGRSSRSDIQIDHDSVSRQHVRVISDDGDVSIEDVGSTNGTFLNASVRIRRETTLKNGDILSFGEVQYWFLLTDTLYVKLRAGDSRSRL